MIHHLHLEQYSGRILEMCKFVLIFHYLDKRPIFENDFSTTSVYLKCSLMFQILFIGKYVCVSNLTDFWKKIDVYFELIWIQIELATEILVNLNSKLHFLCGKKQWFASMCWQFFKKEFCIFDTKTQRTEITTIWMHSTAIVVTKGCLK